jgi:hypothetical protein
MPLVQGVRLPEDYPVSDRSRAELDAWAAARRCLVPEPRGTPRSPPPTGSSGRRGGNRHPFGNKGYGDGLPEGTLTRSEAVSSRSLVSVAARVNSTASGEVAGRWS